MTPLKIGFPFRMAGIYFLLAGTWILLSDRLITRLAADTIQLTFLQTYKGFGFVLVTAAVLYLFLRYEWGVLQREMQARQQAEKALRESETRLIAAQRMAKMGDFTWDLETGAITWSEALFGLMHYDESETIDFAIVNEKIHHPEDMERVTRWIDDCIASGKDELTPNEYRVIGKDGKTLFVRAVGVIQRRQGKQPRIFATLQDISDRAQADQEREKLQAQFLQAQKMESVGRLAGGVAHDFNNMLSVILGYTEMALEKVNPQDPLHGDLGGILSAARRSADITRQLLAFARKQTVAPEILDLNANVEGMLKMLRRLIGENIDLAWHPGKNLGLVKMDPSQIDQILANLCVNARDAITGVGKVTIETGAVHFDAAYCADHPGFVSGDFVRLTVSDDGCGMDRQTLSNLFEPFFTTKGVGKGTGLGLATVYGIVKQNDGFVNVYSEPNLGTTFKIYLPNYEVTEEKIYKQDPVVSDERGNETILVVEDELSILRMTTMLLELLGYAVLTASTPSEALSRARDHADEIHLLITDVVMPEMNGRELAERLQGLYPSLKILFMSGYTASVIAHSGILDKGVKFIQKPFSKKELAVKVRESLDNIDRLEKGMFPIPNLNPK